MVPSDLSSFLLRNRCEINFYLLYNLDVDNKSTNNFLKGS